ncbi:MAG: MBG domain-containing protein, partial [Verrucomicrobiales bacterium]
NEQIESLKLISINNKDTSTFANANDDENRSYPNEIKVTGIDTENNGFNVENYDISYVKGDLTINPRAITLKAEDQEKIYGDGLDLGSTKFTVEDLDGGDLPNGERINAVSLVSADGVDVSTTKGVGLNEGNISIAETSADNKTLTVSNGFNQKNYKIDYETGNLTIKQRTITLKAKDQEKIYGNVLDLGSTKFTVEDLDGGDLPNGEVIDTVSLVSENGVDVSTTKGVGLNEGNISIAETSADNKTLAGSKGFDQKNYKIDYETGNLTINRREITLKAEDQEKIYGNVLDLDDAKFTVKDLDGGGGQTLPNGEKVKSLNLNSLTNKDTSTFASVDEYPNEIQVTGIKDTEGFDVNNYTINYVSGQLSITPRNIILKAEDQEKSMGMFWIWVAHNLQ